MKLRDIDSFPDIKNINTTYHNLIRFSNVNFRDQNEIKLSFDLANFVNKNRLPKLITVRSITELERYGFIAFNINPKHSQSKLKINLNDYEIDSLRSTDEIKFSILKMIIFNTNNIFAIKNPYLKMRSQYRPAMIFFNKKHLNEMADSGLIAYEPGNQNIQLIFKNHEDIHIDHNELEFRKKD